MPFPFDKYPWTNFQELNLAYFIKHFREIFQQWADLYNAMIEWKEATDEDLAAWKANTLSDLGVWETNLINELDAWKASTQIDISAWETATIAALDAWKTATTAVFEQIRTEAAASASAAAGSATDAETAKTAALAAQSAAEAAAAAITSSLTQIQTNANNIADLYSDIRVNIAYLLGTSSDWQRSALNQVGTYTDRVRCQASTTRLTPTARQACSPGDVIAFECPNGWKYRVFFSANSGAINNDTSYTTADAGLNDITTWHSEDREITVPAGSVSFMLTIATVNDYEITTEDLPVFPIYIQTIGALVNILEQEIMNVARGFKETAIPSSWVQGYYAVNGGNNQSSTTRCRTTNKQTIQTDSKYIAVFCGPNKKARITFWNSYTSSTSALIGTTFNTNWKENGILMRIPADAKIYGVSVSFLDNSAITAADCSGILIYEYTENPNINGLTISILGDSISTFAGDGAETAGDGHLIADGTYTYSGNHCRYPNNVVKNVRDCYWMELIEKFNLRLGVNDSWAGSKVSWDGTEGSDKGADIYMGSQTRINHLGLNGYPNIILVEAGTNDIGATGASAVTIGTFNTENPAGYSDAQIAALSVTTFADAYRAMLIRLQKTYPLAQIIVMLPDYSNGYYSPEKAEPFLEVIKEACDYFGVFWVDMRTSAINMYNAATYLSDNVHPNITGMEVLYNRLAKFVESNI